MRQIREQAEHDILAVLPHRADDLARLRVLEDSGQCPTVTVIGKYNHGKSRLLNELIGHDAFAVADKRETVALSDCIHDGVRWLDAPGLDADVATADDHHALQAAWRESDIRLFVHAAKEGELDASERALLQELRDDGSRTRRQTVFVLTQVDQLAGESELEKVAAAIRRQVPGMALNAVSSTRYRQGLEGAKKLLLERSGIPALRNLLAESLARVPAARAHETALLHALIREELEQLHAARQSTLVELQQRQARQRQDFEIGLRSVLDKVARDLEAA